MRISTPLAIALSIALIGACSSGPEVRDHDPADEPDAPTLDLGSADSSDSADDPSERYALLNDLLVTSLESANVITAIDCDCNYESQGFTTAEACRTDQLFDDPSARSYITCLEEAIHEASLAPPAGFEELATCYEQSLDAFQTCLGVDSGDVEPGNCPLDSVEALNTCHDRFNETMDQCDAQQDDATALWMDQVDELGLTAGCAGILYDL